MSFILEKFIGLVFLLAGIHRIFLKEQREYEIKTLLKLPKYTDYFIILIEIIVGIIIIFNLPGKKYGLWTITIITSVGTLLLLYNNLSKILTTYNNLFTLNESSLSVCIQHILLY